MTTWKTFGLVIATAGCMALAAVSLASSSAHITTTSEELLASPQNFWARPIIFPDTLVENVSTRVQRLDRKPYVPMDLENAGTVWIPQSKAAPFADLQEGRTYSFLGTVDQISRKYYIIVDSFQVIQTVDDVNEHLAGLLKSGKSLDSDEAATLMQQLLVQVQNNLELVAQQNNMTVEKLMEVRGGGGQRALERVIADTVQGELRNQQTTADEVLITTLASFLQKKAIEQHSIEVGGEYADIAFEEDTIIPDIPTVEDAASKVDSFIAVAESSANAAAEDLDVDMLLAEFSDSTDEEIAPAPSEIPAEPADVETSEVAANDDDEDMLLAGFFDESDDDILAMGDGWEEEYMNLTTQEEEWLAAGDPLSDVTETVAVELPEASADEWDVGLFDETDEPVFEMVEVAAEEDIIADAEMDFNDDEFIKLLTEESIPDDAWATPGDSETDHIFVEALPVVEGDEGNDDIAMTVGASFEEEPSPTEVRTTTAMVVPLEEPPAAVLPLTPLVRLEPTKAELDARIKAEEEAAKAQEEAARAEEEAREAAERAQRQEQEKLAAEAKKAERAAQQKLREEERRLAKEAKAEAKRQAREEKLAAQQREKEEAEYWARKAEEAAKQLAALENGESPSTPVIIEEPMETTIVVADIEAEKAEQAARAQQEAERREAERVQKEQELQAKRLQAQQEKEAKAEAKRKAREEKLAAKQREKEEAARLRAEQQEQKRLAAEQREIERLEKQRVAEEQALLAQQERVAQLEARRKVEEEQLALKKREKEEIERLRAIKEEEKRLERIRQAEERQQKAAAARQAAQEKKSTPAPQPPPQDYKDMPEWMRPAVF